MRQSPAARVAGLARTVGLVGRHLLGVDTNPVPREWTHLTKVDPEPAKRLPLAYPLYLAHTDAVSVGGSSGVTAADVEATFALLAWATPPAFHEPSAATHVTPTTRERAAFLAVPEVLNGDSAAFIGELGGAVEYARTELVPATLAKTAPWLPTPARDRLVELATSWLIRSAVFEAYVVANPDSAAAREAGVGPEDVLSPRAAAERAGAADRRLGSEVVYLEYSGTFGGDEAVATLEAMADRVSRARLWYGGGLSNRAAVQRVRAAGADAVVVGDAFHRVASEERAVCLDAASALGTDPLPDPATVRRWVADRLDRNPDESAAVAFLATIPSVETPVDRAVAYLTTAVRAWLTIGRARAAEVAPDEGGRRVAAAVGADPGLDTELVAAAGPYLRRAGRDLLARDPGAAVNAVPDAPSERGPTGEPLPVGHFALSGDVA
jgi:phosphoglycerol geranylgeranyltransferase